MGSLEDLFERSEVKWNTYDAILNWLSGNRSKSSYRNTAVILSEPTAIRDEINSANTVEELENLQSSIDGVSISSARSHLNSLLTPKLRRLREAAREEQRVRISELRQQEQEAKEAQEFLQARRERESLSRRSAAQTRRRESERAGFGISSFDIIPENE